MWFLILFYFISSKCWWVCGYLFRLEGIDEDALNEHAVADPEEVVRMVEMWVIFHNLPISTIFFVYKKELVEIAFCSFNGMSESINWHNGV